MSIGVRGLTVSYGDTVVLDGLDLDVASGGVTAVLGRSGCGKTTLLRALAGFVTPDRGEIRLGGVTVFDAGGSLPARTRGVGIVPQEGALFPHLTVADNVAFGLDGDRRARAARVRDLLALVGMAGTEALRPYELSGGMQQRVAVARALSRRPQVVLLDEPFSALDAGLRDEVRTEVLAAIRADGATTLLVTHDQDEALSAADRVAVMRAGRIVQEGTPAEVYGAPVDLEVARFVGDALEIAGTVASTVASTVPGAVASTGDGGRDGGGRGTIGGAAVTVDTALGTLTADRAAGGSAHGSLGGSLGGSVGATGRLVVRPEQVRLDAVGASDGTVQVLGEAQVTEIRYHGHDALVTVRLDCDVLVTARTLGPPAALVGDRRQVVLVTRPRFYPEAS